jgi:hypothetical protein
MSSDSTPPPGGDTQQELIIVERDGEPRTPDLELGKRLGFQRPRAVRQVIERNRAEIEALGPLATACGKSRGQKFTEYFLTEEQALLTATLSDAPKAPAVRALVIRTFVAWRRGHLHGLPPDVMELIRRTDGIARMLSGKVTALQATVASLEKKDAVPSLDFGETVSAYQIIEMAGIKPEDRQRGTAQMVTNRMLAFCAKRQVACIRTPACVNPAEPYRFPYAIVCEWLMGDMRGLELIRNQVERAKARKVRKSGRGGGGQASLSLVPPYQPSA